MSEDWAKKYIGVHTQKQQERGEKRKRQQLAEAVAPDMFQRIKVRIQKDLATFHDAGVLHGLDMLDEETRGRVEIIARPADVELTTAALSMELTIVLVKYSHTFFNSKREREERCGTLRICADLDGTVTVYKNGGKEAFVDESEVSEFLLKPLLDYIDK